MDIVEKATRAIEAVMHREDDTDSEAPSRYARAAIRATLEHYAENVSRGMSEAGKIPTREIPLGNGQTATGFGMGANQDWLFQKMIKQALAELDV